MELQKRSLLNVQNVTGCGADILLQVPVTYARRIENSEIY